MLSPSSGKVVSRVAVLMGGWSHETNYSAYPSIVRSLQNLGYETVALDIRDPNFIVDLRSGAYDVAFVASHGSYGEDGKLQGLLEIMDIPYVGPGVCASAVGMNKLVSKLFFRGLGLTVAEFEYLPLGSHPMYDALVRRLGLPLVIKPIMSGASFGVEFIRTEVEFDRAFARVTAEFGDVLVESYIDGKGTEYSVGVLEDDVDTIVLPICEIIPKSGTYSNASKNDLRLATHVIPARLEKALYERMQSIAHQVHYLLGCRGMSRTDMIVGPGGQIFVLEVNTLPGLLPTSIFPDECKHIGIDYSQMIDMLVRSAFGRRPMEIPKLYDDFPELPESNRPV